VLAHYEVRPTASTLSPAEARAALAFAEAIVPGSARTPGADESTVARAEQIVRSSGAHLSRAVGAALVVLDHATLLTTGKPFHALSRAQQQRLLAGWETNPVLSWPLQLMAAVVKAAHFDQRRPYLAAGGSLRVLAEAPAARWESQIKPAPAWTGSRDLECDVVVVGTGAGGAVVGRELADRGHAVLFVEEGKRHPRTDFVGSAVKAHSTYLLNVPTLGTPPVVVMRGKLVGGSTSVNGATCLRPPGAAHTAWCELTGCEDFSSERMRPYLDRAERALMVSEPERRFIGPIADVFDRGGRALGWRVGPVPRNAVGCEGEGFCDFGCASGARRGVDIAYLAGALERGAMVISELCADRISVEGGRAVGIEGVDADGRRFRIRARAVVLAGGALPTPALLLRQHLANGSGEVGKNLSLHPSVGVTAEFDEALDPQRYIPQGYMLTEFLSDGILVLAAQPDPTIAPLMFPYTGQRFMRAVDSLANLAAFGVLIKDASRGRVWPDVAGRPVVTYSLGKKDVERLHRAVAHTAELSLAAGARRVHTGLVGAPPLDHRAHLNAFRERRVSASSFALVSYHPLGTCRIGRDRRTSVVDLDHEAHDVPGLFIADGSVLPAPPGVNPQLSIIAFAARAGERIAAKL
jgi:choline dehydrogenase-like flavoprotein